MSKIDEIEASLIKNVQSKAFKCVQNLAADAKDNGEYMLGYLDGTSDLCDTLTNTIREAFREAKEKCTIDGKM